MSLHMLFPPPSEPQDGPDPCPECDAPVDVLEEGYECTVCGWRFFYDFEGFRAARDAVRVREREEQGP